MAKLIKVVTLHELLEHKDAEELGLNELVSCGYEEDMKEMYTTYPGAELIERTAVFILAPVRMAFWCHMRLYDSETVQGFTTDVEGLWVAYDEDAEWICGG